MPGPQRSLSPDRRPGPIVERRLSWKVEGERVDDIGNHDFNRSINGKLIRIDTFSGPTGRRGRDGSLVTTEGKDLDSWWGTGVRARSQRSRRFTPTIRFEVSE